MSDPLRCAVVVTHAAHLLTVVGMLVRWRPHVLIMMQPAADGRGALHPPLVQQGLDVLGLRDRTSHLGVSEPQSYARAIDRDFSFHAEIGDRLADWLRDLQPDMVLGDAFELSNFQHDLGRLLIDRAVRTLPQPPALGNHEFPLSYQPVGASDQVYGRFPLGEVRHVALSAEERAIKDRLFGLARVDPLIAHVGPQFESPERETLRAVDPRRDYTQPPPGVDFHYDARGREEVAAGKYATPIGFHSHFVPLVKAL